MEPTPRAVQSRNTSKVFISGISDLHPIEKGIAYYYRGHYIYGQTCIPIQPLPFASKQRINLVGMTGNVAPRYNGSDPNLVSELSINALHYAQMNEYYFGPDAQHAEQHDNSASKTGSILQPIPSSVASEIHGAMSMPTSSHQVLDSSGTNTARLPNMIHESKISISGVAFAPQHLGFGQGGGSGYFVPHDRANYLANSAPGSRFMSRDASPTGSQREDGFQRAMVSTTRLYDLIRDTEPSLSSAPGPSTFIRPAASSAQINRPPYDEGILRSASMDNITDLAANDEWMDDDDLYKHMYPPSLPPSRSQNRYPENPRSVSTTSNEVGTQQGSTSPAPDYLNVHKSEHSNLSRPTNPPPSEPKASPPRRTLFEISQGLPPFRHRHLYLGRFAGPSSTYTNTGRPRAHSVALNEAYNLNNPENSSPYLFGTTEAEVESAAERVTKCALHGDECDGFTVANLHATEHAKRTQGFKEQYPAVMHGGRKMIHWHALLVEESKRLEWEERTKTGQGPRN